ncbi:16240_t:CDS:2 [Cetraspora pellucida]|uniref:16240_t:CDS:1 n=1 Tax=Cetraspora pellucida TaxID=1433469 RepID=A0ACA9KL87_9GLOM|nr:16240_t:CDS:2 [Cetraspora pellucida]
MGWTFNFTIFAPTSGPTEMIGISDLTTEKNFCEGLNLSEDLKGTLMSIIPLLGILGERHGKLLAERVDDDDDKKLWLYNFIMLKTQIT